MKTHAMMLAAALAVTTTFAVAANTTTKSPQTSTAAKTEKPAASAQPANAPAARQPIKMKSFESVPAYEIGPDMAIEFTYKDNGTDKKCYYMTKAGADNKLEFQETTTLGGTAIPATNSASPEAITQMWILRSLGLRHSRSGETAKKPADELGKKDSTMSEVVGPDGATYTFRAPRLVGEGKIFGTPGPANEQAISAEIFKHDAAAGKFVSQGTYHFQTIETMRQAQSHAMDHTAGNTPANVKQPEASDNTKKPESK